MVVKAGTGNFGWVVLLTGDPEGSRAFYERLFGWQGGQVPGGIAFINRDGGFVGSIIDRDANEAARREPAAWFPFVRVDDMERATQKVVALGGRMWGEPYLLGIVRVCLVRGPTGEAIGLWQTPGEPGGPELLADRASHAWFELATREPEIAAHFYRDLFDWRIADEGGYTFIGDRTGQFGGIVKLAGDWEDWAFLTAIGRSSGQKLDVPPHWMVFFAVDDCETVVEEAETLGAQVVAHPEPLHTVGTMAILRDPQGIYFSVLSKG